MSSQSRHTNTQRHAHEHANTREHTTDHPSLAGLAVRDGLLRATTTEEPASRLARHRPDRLLLHEVGQTSRRQGRSCHVGVRVLPPHGKEGPCKVVGLVEAILGVRLVLSPHRRRQPEHARQDPLHLAHVQVQSLASESACPHGQITSGHCAIVCQRAGRQPRLQSDDVGVIVQLHPPHVEHVLKERTVFAGVHLSTEHAIIRGPCFQHPWLALLIVPCELDAIPHGITEPPRKNPHLGADHVLRDGVDEKAAIAAHDLMHLVAAQGLEARGAPDQRAFRHHGISQRQREFEPRQPVPRAAEDLVDSVLQLVALRCRPRLLEAARDTLRQHRRHLHEPVVLIGLVLPPHAALEPEPRPKHALNLNHILVEDPASLLVDGHVIALDLRLQPDDVGLLVQLQGSHVEHVLKQ
mmetsp:Transcript_118587/g.342915  ORF Transcript_118587/g.342915 Transcript_118587/m.342915 type:complete len:410 (+) Transcript_118587:322-1551(+)